MGQGTGGSHPAVRHVLVPLLAALSVLVLTPARAGATGPGRSTLVTSGGAPFEVLSTGNLASGPLDDGLYYLSTTSAAPLQLPFPLRLYDQTFSDIAISTNGTIQLGVRPHLGTASFANDCLPSPTMTAPALAVLWDDLFFNPADSEFGFPQGVFISTTGTAPFRRFVVSWQGLAVITGDPVLAQAVFDEGSPSVMFVYGSPGGGSATVGVQARLRLAATQWTCDNDTDSSVSDGLRLRFDYSAG
jgi:hypothetical protein